MQTAAWWGRLVAGMTMGVAACGGAGPEVGSGAQVGRGAPPENHDTAPARTDSNPSPAPAIVPAQPRVVVHAVNTGPHGMAAQVRWLLAPDRRAMIVVEDPVSVEAEPVPDGFLYASEATGAVVQLNGVWDVAPSPDWSRLAFGRAFVFRSGESETIPPGEWERLFAWLPEDVAAPTVVAMRRRLEPYIFPASGMSYARAVGLAQVLAVAGLPAGRAAVVEAPTVRLEGWRVRWTPSGDTLAVGSAPRAVQDDADATRWTLVRTRGLRTYHDSIGVASPAVTLVRPDWVEGPTLDVSVEIDMVRERRVPVNGGAVVSSHGAIRLQRAAGDVAIGPGAALAATRDGRFIAALAPVEAPREFDPKVRVVVYELTR